MLNGNSSGPKMLFGVGVGSAVDTRVGVRVRVGVTVRVGVGGAVTVGEGSGVFVATEGGRVITKVGGASNRLLHEVIKKEISITRKNLGIVSHISLTGDVYTGIISETSSRAMVEETNATPRQPARF